MRGLRILPHDGDGAGLVVATYNVHTCVGVDHRYDPARVAQVLRELRADIIGLQEVDAGHRHGRHLDQWLYFAEATGLEAVRGASLIDHRGRFGNAILTRFPVLGVRQIDLSVPGREPRGAIDVDLAVEGRVLRVVATHLGLNAAERRIQARRLIERLAAAAGRRDGLIIMGDLNEWRGRRGGIRDARAPPRPRARAPHLSVLAAGAAARPDLCRGRRLALRRHGAPDAARARRLRPSPAEGVAGVARARCC